MVLTFLLYKYFIFNLSSNFPNRVIHVSKQDVFKIESIYYRHEFISVNLTSSSTIDLSKLVYLSKLLIIFKLVININNRIID